MRHSSVVALASVLLVLLCLPKYTSPNLESQLVKSLQVATVCKGSRKPPKEPVLAFSPKRYAQLVAVLRTRTNAPACGGLGSGSFNINEPKTWSFCTLGNCIKEKCNCISSFTGPNCAEFGGKCWLMYCFLNSCKKSFQNLHCKCDPSYYGKEVLSGHYWYDEGKKESYVAPPKHWSDSIKKNEGSKISSVIDDIKFPSFDNKPSSGGDQKQPSKPSQHKASGSKASSAGAGSKASSAGTGSKASSAGAGSKASNAGASQTENEVNSNPKNEDESHSENDADENSEDESEDVGDEDEDESSCPFMLTSTRWMIIAFSATVLCTNWHQVNFLD